MTSIELQMRRTMDLALNGAGSVSPNPLVGCVIVKDDRVIGEGWHQRYGEAHAEVNAVESVSDKSKLAGSTVVVNLEPCSHHGKTPPCSDLLIRHKVGKVIVSNVDSNPIVSGKGIERLRAAGIHVETGVLEKEGRDLNRRFFTFMEKKRPYIILKWAQTINGFIAGQANDPRWISNTISRQLVHRWRSEEDSVLVGYRTALTDNPRLNVREWSGRDPVRIVIDQNLTLPRTHHVLDGSQKTIVFNKVKGSDEQHVTLVKLNQADFLPQLLSNLVDRNIQSLIVEGGRSTLDMFIRAGIWDEARVFESQATFDAGLSAPKIQGRLLSESRLATDTLKVFQNLVAIPAGAR